MNEISGNKPNKVCKTWVHREVTDLWPEETGSHSRRGAGS